MLMWVLPNIHLVLAPSTARIIPTAPLTQLLSVDTQRVMNKAVVVDPLLVNQALPHQALTNSPTTRAPRNKFNAMHVSSLATMLGIHHVPRGTSLERRR